MVRDHPGRTDEPASDGSDAPDGDGASPKSNPEKRGGEAPGDGEAAPTTRRRYLEMVGAAAIPTVLAGCGSQPSTETSTTATEPATRTEGSSGIAAASSGPTNIVDAGADKSGQKPINGVLKEVHGDDVTIRFPPGRYRLDPITLAGSGWTLVGEDATIVVPASVTREYIYLKGSDWTFDGFTIDLSADGAAPTNYLLGTNWEFKNVDFVGQMDDPQYWGDSNLLYPVVKLEDATGLIENVSAMDGSADPGESSNRALTWVGASSKGKMIWRGCQFSKWAENTLYLAESSGPIVVEDCFFKNTNVGVRVGGDAVVRNCLWMQDGRVPTQRWSGDANGRGVWINSNGYAPGPVEIIDCDFVMTGEDAVAAIKSLNRVDDVTIRNTRIKQRYDQSAIELPGKGSTTIRNVSITGSVTKSAIDIWERDRSVVSGCCINQPGNGVRISNSQNCRVENSTVNVEGDPFVFVDSDVTTENISKSGTCPAPDKSNPATDG